MGRVLLIHWNEKEALERAERLRRAGHAAEVLAHSKHTGPVLRAIPNDVPRAVVIDLDRAPSHGRDCAIFLRGQKATRCVPLVFVAGAPDTRAAVNKLLPDAVYAQWRGIKGALRKAIAQPPAKPVTPGRLAGYSGTPLPKKLGIKEGSSLMLLASPAGFERTLGKLPAGVKVLKQARGAADRVMLFARSRSELNRRFPAAKRAIAPAGGLWIAWPKKTSRLAADLSQTEVRAHGLASGLVDYKICAIDGDWSGLLFARRARKP